MHRVWIVSLICAGTAAGFVGGMLFYAVRAPEAVAPEPALSDAPVEEPAQLSADTSQSAAVEDASPPLPMPEIRKPNEPEIHVAVTGAVRRPGVYRFQNGARVRHGIEAAGGLLENADVDDINIAARLMDDTTLCIPFRPYAHREDTRLIMRGSATAPETNPPRYTRSGWTPAPAHAPLPAVPAASPPPAASLPETESRLIPLNSATSEDLQRLPGIGPKTAEKIIAHREEFPFQQIDDLANVPGIGPKRLEAVRHLVTVD